MKQIVKNSYIEAFAFASSQEASTFVNNQGAKKQLSIDGTFGDNHYCYVSYHSITKEKQFALSFCSDSSEEGLNFLFWENLFVLDTGKNIYLIDEDLNIKTLFDITTPLVGLYLINKEKLLILEEAYLRVINCNGDILKTELFDLIEDFSIKDNYLSIQTSEESKIIDLI